MEITEHNNDDTISIELAVKSKRLRNSVKSSLSDDIDAEKNVSSSSSVSDNSDSEEEWNFAKTKTKIKVPKQTLKTKLAEKTKYLRKISKLTSLSEEKCSTHRVPKSSEDEMKLGILKIKPNSELCEIKNFEEKNENNDLAEDVKKVDEIHHYATAKDDSEPAKICKIKNEETERDVIVKEECIKGNLSEDKKTSNQEPIVLICAINRPTPTTELDVSTPQASTARHGIVPQHSSQGILVSSHISPSLVTNSSGQILSPGVSQNSTFNTDVQRNHSAIVEFSNSHKNLSSNNSNLTTNNNFLPPRNTILEQRYSPVQSSPSKNGLSYSSRRNALANSVFQSTPPSPALQRTPNRTYNAILRTPSPAQQTAHRNLRISRSGNSLGKTKLLLSPNQAGRSPNLKNHRSNPSSPVSSNKNNRNSMLNKFNNISPSGTVIHTGTGSVTITPRKVIPERPPVQRKLFKNEIEGTISCRSAQGTLQYVVNLANGTHIPLSNMQVQKLREQHNGALPIKLKIPVPCDVADKIEPSFLIED